VVQTAGLPPNHGKICLLSRGWTWNNKKALVKIVNAKGRKLQGLGGVARLLFMIQGE
jgi:hypothetical protein